MAKKKPTTNKPTPVTEEDDFDEPEDDLFDDYEEEVEFKKTPHRSFSDARRRHERIKEDRELERLLNYDYHDDQDYGDFEDRYR